MDINLSIFREYDIRGIVGKDIEEPMMTTLGKAYGAYMQGRLKNNLIVVGRDGREHSKRLSQALIRGVTACGVNVIDIGEIPSPLAYYAANTLPVDGFLMLTASHNPGEYNGLKVGVGGNAIYGAEIQRFGKIAIAGQFPESAVPGTVTVKDLVPEYLDYVLNIIRLKRPLKVVVDGGNGVSGPIVVPLFERLGCMVIPLYCDVDGRFPNHHPDPTKKANLTKLIETVLAQKADLGIAFDGDGDRIGGCDDQGTMLQGDRLLALFARSVLKDVPGATIIGEVKCSRGMYEDIRKHGGEPLMYRTGHSLIKAKMKEVGAELAGEMSGHIFFKHRWFGFDDAAYAGARLLELVSESSEPLSALLASIPKRFDTPEIEIVSDDQKKFEVVQRATEYFQENLGLEVVTVDGARIEFSDGWGLLRASNTAPKLVARVEADSEARMNEILTLIQDKVAELNK